MEQRERFAFSHNAISCAAQEIQTSGSHTSPTQFDSIGRNGRIFTQIENKSNARVS